jgi:hypothetical protein
VTRAAAIANLVGRRVRRHREAGGETFRGSLANSGGEREHLDREKSAAMIAPR